MWRHRYCAAGVAAFVVAACAGSGEGLDASGRPIGSGGSGDGELVATFESIQTHVFTPVCTGCHAGASAPQGLRLDAGSSYDLLVGVPSNEVSSLQRVAPGDPDRSYLIRKLEGSAAVGGRMPLYGPYLDAATIAVIRQWISDGATRTASAASAQPTLALAVSVPANGAVVSGRVPTPLLLAFTRELDVTRLDSSHVHLERLDEGDSARSTALAFDLSPVAANTRALKITPRTTFDPGRYVLRVDAAGLADLDGNALGTTDRTGTPSGVRVMFEVEDSR